MSLSKEVCLYAGTHWLKLVCQSGAGGMGGGGAWEGRDTSCLLFVYVSGLFTCGCYISLKVLTAESCEYMTIRV